MTKEEHASFMDAYDLCAESERRQTHSVAISEIGLTREALAEERRKRKDAEVHAAVLREALERCVREACNPRRFDEESWDHDIQKPWHWLQEALSATPISCGERMRALEAVALAAKELADRVESSCTVTCEDEEGFAVIARDSADGQRAVNAIRDAIRIVKRSVTTELARLRATIDAARKEKP